MIALTKRGKVRERDYPERRNRKDATPLARVMRYVEKDPATGCWEWQAHLRSGYGSLSIKYKLHYAHRVTYEALIGPIPDGLQIDHLCRNRACCNPLHLEAVTCQENVLRGYSPGAVARRRDACLNGHAYTEENTYLWRGCRRCRECNRTRAKKWRERQIASEPRTDGGPAHGTLSRYTHASYRCRCDECRAAMRDYQRARRQRPHAA